MLHVACTETDVSQLLCIRHQLVIGYSKRTYQSLGSLSGTSLADINSYATSSCILLSATSYIIQQPTRSNNLLYTINQVNTIICSHFLQKKKLPPLYNASLELYVGQGQSIINQPLNPTNVTSIASIQNLHCCLRLLITLQWHRPIINF